ncbi:MAG: DUF2680 domain-containing protein [bacterium]|nr:DUF2680 domain-containing protein [bacterium]
MFNKKIAMVGMSMMMAVSSIAPATVFAAGETTTEATSKETSNKQNGKPTEEEKQQMKAKMEAAVSKWDKLSAEKKAEVYKLLEEEKAVKIKVLDKMVSLGVMDEADAKEVKTRMEERFAKMKESGKFPLGRPCPKHDKKDSNKEKNDD